MPTKQVYGLIILSKMLVAQSILVLGSEPLVPCKIKAIHLPSFNGYYSIVVTDNLAPSAWALEHIRFIAKPIRKQLLRTTCKFVLYTGNTNQSHCISTIYPKSRFCTK